MQPHRPNLNIPRCNTHMQEVIGGAGRPSTYRWKSFTNLPASLLA